MARKKASAVPSELYSDEQLRMIEDHIEKYYGAVDNYYQEKETTDIRLNIYVIPPSTEKRYYTLATAGMGAHLMNIPKDLDRKKLQRAELIICMPPSWKPDSDDMNHYWPLHLLKLLARLPIEENAWLGWGHTVDYGTGFAENTELCGVMLVDPPFGKGSTKCSIGDEEKVNFYQVIPLYAPEIAFKNRYGASALLHEFGDEDVHIVDVDRRSSIPENFTNIIDNVERHSNKIVTKELDIPEINGANHISAFFRWLMEHKMLNDEFKDFFKEELKQLKKGEYDIRRFIINSLGGELTMDILTDEGQAFADYYYDFYSSKGGPSFPSDVDSVALDHFGEEKYNCEEFGDEAYLFVPYNDDYFKAMNKRINRNYRKFKKMVEAEETAEAENNV